eukprot:GEMP01017560.1.p1 GENE.GEMP01017560.1~~GEMP01017560.1.p1  ORF type:complete len:602 (+),score=112.41 GEMP01017560.1:33-1838(+)
MFSPGDHVWVFYRMSKMPTRWRHIAVADKRQGIFRPRMGLSEGWIPAQVDFVESKTGKNKELVHVTYLWTLWYSCQGNTSDPHKPSDLKDAYPADHVRAMPTIANPIRLICEDPPELAIIAFRWGHKYGFRELQGGDSQWGASGPSISDSFIGSILNTGVVPRIGLNFELWSVFIEEASDMTKMAESAHHIFATHPARRAKNLVAMYFLYPTGFDVRSIPTYEVGDDEGAGFVERIPFFNMMRAVERVGIPSKFPHASHLYDLLAGKQWTYSLCLDPDYCLPACVALPRQDIESLGCNIAGQKALAALNRIKKAQNSPGKQTVDRGVAKLGYSWEALDVKYWQGINGFIHVLNELSQQIQINQEYTAQPHDLDVIICQEYVEHDLEMRMYVVNGKIEVTIYTKFLQIKSNFEFGNFQSLDNEKIACTRWLFGDQEAIEDAKAKGERIVNKFLDWLVIQTCEVPCGIRFDFFVKRVEPGVCTIHTLEICEMGFSVLANKELPKKIFPALVGSCFKPKYKEIDEKQLNRIVHPTAGPTELSTNDKHGGKDVTNNEINGNGHLAHAESESASPPPKGKGKNGKSGGKTYKGKGKHGKQQHDPHQ